MKNGWNTRLRTAQARSTSVRMNRAVLHALCFARGCGGTAVRPAPRRANGSCIRSLLSAGGGEVKPGWQLLMRPLCAAAMAREREHSGQRTLEELFAAEPDRLARLSFEVAGLY